MSEREAPAPEPERLLQDRELGKLISQANGVYRARLDESAAFQRLSARLERPERSWRWQGLTLGAVLSAAAGVVMVLGVSNGQLFDGSLFDGSFFDGALFDGSSGHVALGPELSTGRRMLRDGREPPEQEALPPAAAGGARHTSSDDGVGSVVGQLAPDRTQAALHEPDGDATRRDGDAPSHDDLRASPPPRERQAARREASQREVERREAARGEAARGEAARSEPSTPDGEARAQLVAAPPLAARPTPAATADNGPASSVTPSSVTPGSVTPGSAAPGSATPGSATPGSATPGSAEAPSSTARAVEARVDCSDLLQQDALAAEHCYSQRAAESSGLSAEAALYELARLRRDVQQDAKGALAALNEYRDRFPHGSLRNEVGLSRVELLSELGRSREALNEADALLRSAQGGERAAELYLLRGDIFRRDLADFAGAAQEYSKAEKFGGGFGAEATRLRGLSLEALGDVEGALAAYRRYLRGPEQPRKGEVHRRVEALTSSQRGRTP